MGRSAALPPPNIEHQDLEGQIETWLRQHWVREELGNKVYHQVALSPREDWLHNYRTLDVVLFNSSHLKYLRPTYCHGPYTVAVEIRSPGDETYEKFGFYAQLGVPELWVIDRDSKQPEIHVLESGIYCRQTVDPDGWLRSRVVSVMLKHDKGTLSMQSTDHVGPRQR